MSEYVLRAGLYAFAILRVICLRRSTMLFPSSTVPTASATVQPTVLHHQVTALNSQWVKRAERRISVLQLATWLGASLYAETCWPNGAGSAWPFSSRLFRQLRVLQPTCAAIWRWYHIRVEYSLDGTTSTSNTLSLTNDYTLYVRAPCNALTMSHRSITINAVRFSCTNSIKHDTAYFGGAIRNDCFRIKQEWEFYLDTSVSTSNTFSGAGSVTIHCMLEMRWCHV
jgi:hypothetical protein